MLNICTDRYKNYLVKLPTTRNILPNLKHQKKIKIFYKKMFIHSLYLKRQIINLYKPVKKFSYNYFFMTNIIIKKKFFEKDDKRVFFSWTNTTSLYKSKISKDKYMEFFDLFFTILPKTPTTSFKYYWLTAFFYPEIKTRFYYFTNRIKFFLNQRLIRQSVLVMYNTTNKNNTYNNNSKFFKGLILKNNLNSLFLLKTAIFQLHPKFGTKSYFFRHKNFLKKFITDTYLKINAYIAQW